MSENTVNKALRSMGYDTKTDVCGHGFRAMACSALVESGLWSRDAVERQMSHQEHNNVRAAYIYLRSILMNGGSCFCGGLIILISILTIWSGRLSLQAGDNSPDVNE